MAPPGRKILDPGNHDVCWRGRKNAGGQITAYMDLGGIARVVDASKPVALAAKQVQINHFPCGLDPQHDLKFMQCRRGWHEITEPQVMGLRWDVIANAICRISERESSHRRTRVPPAARQRTAASAIGHRCTSVCWLGTEPRHCPRSATVKCFHLHSTLGAATHKVIS